VCRGGKRGLQPWKRCEAGAAQSWFNLMTNHNAIVGRARAIDTIPLGGLLIGLFDLIFAFTFYGLILDVPLLRIFQSVAAGVLGRPAAVAGGVPTFLLGIVLHFVVATCIATVYFLATLVLPVLLRHPIVSGLIYGMVAYFGMKYLVLPLSAIGRRGTLPRLPILITELIGHALLVGLPVALLAQRSARAINSDSAGPGRAEPDAIPLS
jgi:hypothetical protein